ncbi:S26 family signal peptidase [Vibrio rotiferianus]
MTSLALNGRPIGFVKPKTSVLKRLVTCALISLCAYGALSAFLTRYKVNIDITPQRCLSAWVYLLDTKDKEIKPGDLISIEGHYGILPDKYRYTKMVGGVSGQKVTYDGMYIENSNGFKKYAPPNKEYYKLKKERNLPTEWNLKGNELFLMGDTQYSLDSRVVGLADASYILGKAYVLF